MRSIRSLGLLAGCLLVVPLAGAQSMPGAFASTQNLRCESNDGRQKLCPADTRGGVRFSRQLSRGACVQGRSWGIQRDGVWVSQGCRADFVIGERGGSRERDDRDSSYRGGDRVVRCESGSGRSNFCSADTRRGVELIRQLSRSACIRDQSWGWDNRGIWVSGGCRAEFRVRTGGWEQGRGRRDDHGRDPGRDEIGTGIRSVRCESADGRERFCPIDTRNGVRVSRQISRTACIEGDTWGHDRGGVWVSRGCRADFESGYGSDRRSSR